MKEKPTKKTHPGRRGNAISANPLSMDQLVDGIFQIKPEDVKQVIAATSRKKKRKK